MQKGNTAIIALLIAVVILGGGFFTYRQNQQTKMKLAEEQKMTMKKKEEEKLMKDEVMKRNTAKEDVMMEKSGYTGKVLAGKSSPYLEFNQANYDNAIKEGKVVFLDFYANWCPICRAETPNIEQGFNELDNPNVIGFRVNFNDNDTDNDEKALAKKFNVPYQHTKIILKNRKEVFRTSDAWEKDTFLMEIDKATKNN